jgi:hypothetical protein
VKIRHLDKVINTKQGKATLTTILLSDLTSSDLSRPILLIKYPIKIINTSGIKAF